MPRVSVIVPLHNKREYVGHAIDSVLNQTFGDFELLVIDDCSTDDGWAVVEQYSDSRIKLIRNQYHRGISGTRNIGIEVSDSDYIAWLDADDLSMPRRLERQVGFLDQNPSFGLCASRYVRIDPAGKQISSALPERIDIPAEWALFWGNPIAQSSVMLRRSAVREHGLRYDLRYEIAEDYDMWCKIVACCRAAILGDVLTLYRVLGSGAYEKGKVKAFGLALRSSAQLLQEVQGGPPPSYWRSLVKFAKLENGGSVMTDSAVISTWLSSLLGIATDRWRWDNAETAAARSDADRMLVDHGFKLSWAERLPYLWRVLTRKPLHRKTEMIGHFVRKVARAVRVRLRRLSRDH